jgi:hypothetical protein
VGEGGGEVSDLVLAKAADGHLEGLDDADRRAYARFQAALRNMAVGDTMRFSFFLPRSQKHHRLFFQKLTQMFEMQEQFDNKDRLRAWMTVGAGYCDLTPGPHGTAVAIPQSIKWESMDEADFSDLHSRVDAFMWSPRARRFLWPHLDDAKTYEMIDAWRLSFGD